MVTLDNNNCSKVGQVVSTYLIMFDRSTRYITKFHSQQDVIKCFAIFLQNSRKPKYVNTCTYLILDPLAIELNIEIYRCK